MHTNAERESIRQRSSAKRKFCQFARSRAVLDLRNDRATELRQKAIRFARRNKTEGKRAVFL